MNDDVLHEQTFQELQKQLDRLYREKFFEILRQNGKKSSDEGKVTITNRYVDYYTTPPEGYPDVSPRVSGFDSEEAAKKAPPGNTGTPYQYQYQFQYPYSQPLTPPQPRLDDELPGMGGVPVSTPQPKISPTLPDHIYVRQEGSPQRAVIYDADKGKPVENVTDVEVTLRKNDSKVRVKASDGERTYPVQDLTVDANINTAGGNK